MPRKPTVRRGHLPAESEAAFQSKTVLFARYHGWMVHHAPAGGKAGRVDHEQIGAGFPDLWLVRAPRLVIAELKAENAPPRVRVPERHLLEQRPEWLRDLALTHDQAAWLEALRAVADTIVAAQEADYDLNGITERVRPLMEVHLWRPSDWPLIEQVLARTSWEGGP